MIQINKISLALGAKTIFDDFSCTIDEQQRVGLVGRNGSGKTTLFNVLAGLQSPDSGNITIPKDKKVGYFPQEVVLTSDKSILDETFSSFETLHALTEESKHLEQQLEKDHNNHDLIDRYATVQSQLIHEQPERDLAKTKKMLLGLGFSEQQFSMPVSNLSVGWKMRISLAKLLLKNADFYLFDEPTNHLDLIAKEWFLGFLKKADFGFILICHERYFLDELCTHILELEHGKAIIYHGGYSGYEQQKEHNLNMLETAYRNQQKEIQRKEDTIERFRAKASKAKMAQSMIKSLDKVERITLPPGPKNINFTFSSIGRAGKVVLTVNHIAQKFESKKIFENVSFEILRDQKVAIVAPNGVGKTTLFNVISGKLSLQSGSVEFGHNVKHAVFAQDQTTLFNPKLTVMENISMHCPDKTEQQLRTMLGAFLFGSNDVYKKVQVLSGGEKNRLGMVRIFLQDANLILLDEPTNHLDIPSKDVLLKALQAYPGTIIFVSHDRDFINNLATHIIELNVNGTKSYHGNYDSYVMQQETSTIQPIQESKAVESDPENKMSSREAFEQRKKMKRMESKIEKLEAQIPILEQELTAKIYGSPEFMAIQAKLDQTKNDLKEQRKQWQELYAK
jgi:ATP-binding cassette subfamily F protein 3